ncbi:MAG: PilZ domain-containing protein [Planctomycetes bacterium]|nr:PilZ domain-containing protein [Planctomycetota bacterium]
MHENRKFHRLPFHADVSIHAQGGEDLVGTLDNISLRGVLVNLNDESAQIKFKKCKMQIKLNDSSRTLNFKADVVYQSENAIGMHFTEVDLDSLTFLREILDANSDNNQVVEHEMHQWINSECKGD